MVFDVLRERGFVQQCTDEDAVRALLAAPPVTVYIGYDPTADSLHVGNLFTLMALRHLQAAGHRCVAVLGGGTARVGDPSGKTEMRKLLEGDTIAANAVRIREQIARILNVRDAPPNPSRKEPGAGGGTTIVVDNAQWLLELRYVDFLRDIGRHFSVNRMLAAEAYKQRLERGLSFIEFNYQLLQAYDFVELRRRYDCRLQMGGDDQWGNILAGVDLCRRLDGELVHGLTLPLQLTATGEKMGKTAAGAVWLAADRFSPYDYYQYWVNTHDEDVVRMLGFFTLLPMDEVRAVASLEGAELNQAKAILAYEATRLLHGEAAAADAHQGAQAGFGGRVIGEHILPSSTLPRGSEADLGGLPTTALSAAQLAEGIPLLDLMILGGLAKSKGEARRLIEQGAVKVGEDKATDQMRRVDERDLDGERAVVVRVGKKKLHRFVQVQ